MLIIIHNEWLYVQKISSKTVWWVIILLFASSLFPYVTAIVSTNFTDSLAQVVYGLVVLFITVSNRGLYRSLYQDDPNNLLLKQRIEDMKKWIFFGYDWESRQSCLVSHYFSVTHASFRSFDSGSSFDSKATEGGLGLV